jgi:hypothetical protein
MIQEYLLLKNDEIKAIKECKPNEVKLRSFSANKGKCRYVQFSVEGDNEEVAKILSKLDDTIRERFHVTILESGCAAYFNKRLYPLINNFENKLRKLLYLTSAINEKSESDNNITNLEGQTLGQIFMLLFIDNGFMNIVNPYMDILVAMAATCPFFGKFNERYMESALQFFKEYPKDTDPLDIYDDWQKSSLANVFDIIMFNRAEAGWKCWCNNP